jgi:hypothetical protein
MQFQLRQMAGRQHARVLADECWTVGDQAAAAAGLLDASLSTLT